MKKFSKYFIFKYFIISDRFNFKKLLNLLFALFHGILFKDISSSTYPPVIVFENSNECNLSCSGCGYQLWIRNGINKKANFDINKYYDMLNESYKYILGLVFYIGGEPFINDSSFAMIKYANNYGIKTISSTNGSYSIPNFAEKIINSGLDIIIFTISGVTQEIHSHYHVGGNLSLTLNSIKNLVNLKHQLKKKRPFIVLRYILFDYNNFQVDNFIQLAGESNVDFYEIRENESNFWPKNNNPTQTDTNLNFCWYPWFTLIIRADSTVIPCCYEIEELNDVTILDSQSIKEVWNNQDFKKLRRDLLNGRKNIPGCNKCLNGQIPNLFFHLS